MEAARRRPAVSEAGRVPNTRSDSPDFDALWTELHAQSGEDNGGGGVISKARSTSDDVGCDIVAGSKVIPAHHDVQAHTSNTSQLGDPFSENSSELVGHRHPELGAGNEASDPSSKLAANLPAGQAAHTCTRIIGDSEKLESPLTELDATFGLYESPMHPTRVKLDSRRIRRNPLSRAAPSSTVFAALGVLSSPLLNTSYAGGVRNGDQLLGEDELQAMDADEWWRQLAEDSESEPDIEEGDISEAYASTAQGAQAYEAGFSDTLRSVTKTALIPGLRVLSSADSSTWSAHCKTKPLGVGGTSANAPPKSTNLKGPCKVTEPPIDIGLAFKRGIETTNRGDDSGGYQRSATERDPSANLSNGVPDDYFRHRIVSQAAAVVTISVGNAATTNRTADSDLMSPLIPTVSEVEPMTDLGAGEEDKSRSSCALRRSPTTSNNNANLRAKSTLDGVLKEADTELWSGSPCCQPLLGSVAREDGRGGGDDATIGGTEEAGHPAIPVAKSCLPFEMSPCQMECSHLSFRTGGPNSSSADDAGVTHSIGVQLVEPRLTALELAGADSGLTPASTKGSTAGAESTITGRGEGASEMSLMTYCVSLCAHCMDAESVRGKQARLTLWELLEHFDMCNDLLFLCRVAYSTNRPEVLANRRIQLVGKVAIVHLICIWVLSLMAYGLRRYFIYHRIAPEYQSIFCPLLVFRKIRQLGELSPQTLYMFERLSWTYQSIMRLLEDIPQLIVSVAFLGTVGRDPYTYFMIAYSCMLMVITSVRMGLMYPLWGTLSLLLSRQPPIDSPVLAEASTTTKEFALFMTVTCFLWAAADVASAVLTEGIGRLCFSVMSLLSVLTALIFLSYWIHLTRQQTASINNDEDDATTVMMITETSSHRWS